MSSLSNNIFCNAVKVEGGLFTRDLLLLGAKDIFGLPHVITVRSKDEIHWYDHVIAFFVGRDWIDQWAKITVDMNEKGPQTLYVNKYDLSNELGLLSTSAIKIDRLASQILEKLNLKALTYSGLMSSSEESVKQPLLPPSPELIRPVVKKPEPVLEEVVVVPPSAEILKKVAKLKQIWPTQNQKTLTELCQYIEDNQASWQKILAKKQDRMMKVTTPIKKNQKNNFTVYIVKGKKPGTFKTIINLGKGHFLGKGQFKDAFKALNYDNLKYKALTKGDNELPGRDEVNADEAKAMQILPNAKNLLQTPYIQVMKPGRKEKQYMVMKLCDLGELEKYQAKHGKLSEEQKNQITLDVLKAMMDMHAAGYVNRDIKPSNIFLYTDKKDDVRGMVADLGFAIKLEGDVDFRGSPLYMSPERFLDIVKIRRVQKKHAKPADAFSLGLSLHILHFGSNPYKKLYEEYFDTKFISNDMYLLSQKMEEKYSAELSKAIGPVQEVIYGLMNPNPTQRLTIEDAYNKLNAALAIV